MMSVGSTAVSAAYDSPASHHSASSPKQVQNQDTLFTKKQKTLFTVLNREPERVFLA